MKNQDQASNSKSNEQPAGTKTGNQQPGGQSAQDEQQSDIPKNPKGQQRPGSGGQANDASESDDDEAAEFDGLVKRH